MQTTKLALHTIKNNDSMFDVEITENVLDAERISYVVLFNDVLATNAYDETFYVSFRTAEEADKYVQEYVDNNGMKFVDIDNDTIISTKHNRGTLQYSLPATDAGIKRRLNDEYKVMKELMGW